MTVLMKAGDIMRLGDLTMSHYGLISSASISASVRLCFGFCVCVDV